MRLTYGRVKTRMLMAGTLVCCAASPSPVLARHASAQQGTPPAHLEDGSACGNIPLRSDISALPSKRFLMVGEIHGTAQAPGLVGDIACQLAAKGKPIAVALEFPDLRTPDLQRYVDSAGTPEDCRKLLASSIWNPARADGRSSVAMLGLLERLRQLKRAGRKVEVFGTLPSTMVHMSQSYYELAMAYNWAMIADQSPDSTILVLVGRLHASTAAGPAGFPPAASHLPSDELINLRPEDEGGLAWNCQRDGCGPHDIEGGVRKPGYVSVFATPMNGFAGTYTIGGPYEASPPAVAKAGNE